MVNKARKDDHAKHSSLDVNKRILWDLQYSAYGLQII
jgi:hypothetical protein